MGLYTPYYIEVMKSDTQLTLERQGCVFKGQELLSAHELDPLKPCKCGRPNGDGKTTLYN